jgi:hypothetical protein
MSQPDTPPPILIVPAPTCVHPVGAHPCRCVIVHPPRPPTHSRLPPCPTLPPRPPTHGVSQHCLVIVCALLRSQHIFLLQLSSAEAQFPFISLAHYPAGWDGAGGAAERGEQHGAHVGHATAPAVGHHTVPALGHTAHVAHAAPTVAHMAAAHQVVGGFGSTGMRACNNICIITDQRTTYHDYPGAHMCPSCRCPSCRCLIVRPSATHPPTPATPLPYLASQGTW